VRHVIFNADDFGASRGINRGIVEAHTAAVVTSTSLMVEGVGAREAAAMSRDYPNLAIGLHWDVVGEDEREFDCSDPRAVKSEFARQLDLFERLMKRRPTHVDSHKHVHAQPGVIEIFRELVEPLGLPLRHDGRVRFIGGFYAQWEWQLTELKYVSVEFLQQLLRDEVAPAGWTEISCHPGYASDDFTSVYMAEREVELRTLIDPRVRETIDAVGLTLASYADWCKSHHASSPVAGGPP
jgi:predicted glycoside hydrolase/deacetylase ChbG (UPF0249 family)